MSVCILCLVVSIPQEERLGAALTQLEAQRKALVVAQSLSEVADSKVTELQAKVKDATETIDRMTGAAQESKVRQMERGNGRNGVKSVLEEP